MECREYTATKMAASEEEHVIHTAKLSTDDKLVWVPLSLTLVEYPQGDWLGKFLALSSLLPFGIISGFVALILFRRDLHTITFFFGTTLNELLNLILKHTFCEARPMQRNALYTEYGMPSSHSQFMWFFATYIVYFVCIRLHHMNNSTLLENIWKTAIIISSLFLAALVTVSRVYLQYHTWKQVLSGALVGFLFGSLWFALTYLIFTPMFPLVASWRISEFLLLRDTTLIPNVLWFEYKNSRQEARARSRKLVSMKSQ
ncbi:dolichyldiphosphatase 1-like [Schistocerca piceifrons]|uniref:dolichyldiphosphatase 1-like n=1 Tax=Schistocerca piceifrons TaxID=274613 RepID=UPI001F5FC3AC|nr:dolichyldiphosphatase 1-like [Schistocerca piceifrons]